MASNGQTANLDGFGRLTTATPTTIFQTHPAFSPEYGTIDYLSTGKGNVFVDISNTIVLQTVSTAGDKAVRQSHEYLLYQPGKLQTCFLTFTPQVSGTFDSSVVVRAGLFDDYRDKNTAGSSNPGTGLEVNQKSMGHYFELSGNSWFVCERANSSNNVALVNRIPQSNWNLDTLNGNPATCPSGYTIPTSQRPFLGLIERQWLGVGMVRMGFAVNGRIIYCHMFHQRNYTSPYTHLPKLPLRWEIEKVSGGQSVFAQMGSICGTVQVLGDYLPLANIFTLPHPLIATTLTATTANKVLLAIRLRQQYCRATVKLKDVQLYSSGDGMYTIYKNPTITGGTLTYTAHPDRSSFIEYSVQTANSALVVSNNSGIPLRSGFFSKTVESGDSINVSELLTATSFASDIHGACDILVLAVQSFSGNITVNGNLRWIEII